MLSRQQIVELYRRRARHYDLTANLYKLLGFRETTYRRKAVAELRLAPGSTVIELGCGTGLNFRLLQRRIGSRGRLIGVDMTDSMLARARERVRRHSWRNVELVHTDIATYEVPSEVDGILSTFALTLVPEYDDVIRRSAVALAPRGRMVVLDFKEPEGVPEPLVRLAVALASPFAVTRDLATREPWTAIRRHFERATVHELYFGFAYVAAGAVQPNPH